VVIVVVAAIIVAFKIIRGDGSPLTEDDPVPSRMFAPSGIIPTVTEREVQRQWDTLRPALLRQSALSPAESPGTAAP
jgi:carbon starvation protein